MEIEKRLPFECCETCGEFVLKVQERTLFYSDRGSTVGITVSCKNEGKCRHLRRNLEKMGEVNNA